MSLFPFIYGNKLSFFFLLPWTFPCSLKSRKYFIFTSQLHSTWTLSGQAGFTSRVGKDMGSWPSHPPWVSCSHGLCYPTQVHSGGGVCMNIPWQVWYSLTSAAFLLCDEEPKHFLISLAALGSGNLDSMLQPRKWPLFYSAQKMSKINSLVLGCRLSVLPVSELRVRKCSSSLYNI